MKEREPVCPYCKGVHYSIYNAERCAVSHEIKQQLADIENSKCRVRLGQIDVGYLGEKVSDSPDKIARARELAEWIAWRDRPRLRNKAL